MNKVLCYLIVCGFTLVFSSSATFGQVKDSLKADTASGKVKPDFVTRMQKFAEASAIESAKDFDADKAAIAQNRIFEELKIVIQKEKSFLNSGLDTTGAKQELAAIEINYGIAVDGVLINRGTAQTFRNLTASSKILSELQSKALSRKSGLDLQQQTLNNFRYQMDSLISVPDLFKFPTDSAVLYKYMQQLKVVAFQMHPVDSALKSSTNAVQDLLNKANMQVLMLQTSIDEVNSFQKKMGTSTLERDFSNIWEEAGYYRPFKEILKQAKAKGLLTLSFYAQNNAGKLVILVLLVLTSFIYIRSLRKIYIEKQLLTADFDGQLVLRYPLASAMLIVINTFQFFFFSPPFILMVIFWSISSICLTLMFKGFIVRYWMNVWLSMVVLFLITAVDNLILQASRSERWAMLFLAVLGVIVGVYVLTQGRREALRERLILVAIGLMIFIEFGSVLSNSFGRYNLAKALLISGYLNVIVAILFLWTIRLINEGLFLAFNVYTKQEPKLFYLNFEKVGQKVPVVFYVLLVFGWVVLFGRNFAGFDYIAGPLRDFFSRVRTIGSYDFSINGILLFFVIMGIAVLTSRIVSFFASDKHLSHSNEENNSKQGIGSWLLLVRIIILGIGLFLAVAAAGIPLDRIALVLGALGLGIGFGLQALVNNLVSGLIIAFEKPVNVGDVVEVDGKAGVVKSVGFRSSVITTYEGADVIIPNGDLLNSHVTNWSMGGGHKRSSLLIGLSYDADLQKAQSLLSDVLTKEDRLRHIPEPIIQFEQFNESSIDVRIYFWTKRLSDSGQVKSDLIVLINNVFKLNGLSIPYRQQDVHLHMPDRKDKTINLD